MSQIWQESGRKEEELSGILTTADGKERKAKIHYKYAAEKRDTPEKKGANEGTEKVKDNKGDRYRCQPSTQSLKCPIESVQ